MLRIDTEYRGDLTKLDKILKSQEEQKELLKNEIKNLRLKSRPLPPITCQGKTKLDSKRKTKKEMGKDVVAVIDVETGESVAAELIEPQEEREGKKAYISIFRVRKVSNLIIIVQNRTCMYASWRRRRRSRIGRGS